MSGDFVIIGVGLYFLAVSLAVWLLFIPGVRQRLAGSLARLWNQGRAQAGTWAQRGGQGLQQAAGPAVQWGDAAGQGLRAAWRRDWPWWSLALLLLAGIPAAALWLRHFHAYDGFDHRSSRAMNPQVAALLQGEQLVPPAPLPPELFLTREVEQAHPMVASASRNWDLLDADFRQRLLVVFKLMREEHGLEMVLIEGYRSPERQAALAALGPQVTRAGPGQSLHQQGLAADCAFLIGGRIVISEADAAAARGYELLGRVAQSAGLTWGGSWRSIRDLGHVEWRRGTEPAGNREQKE